MGKKRSKVSKQKQAKATAASRSRKFGVSVKKGGGREQTTALVLDSKKKQPRSNATKSINKPVKPQAPWLGKDSPNQKPRSHEDEEQADFDRQFASMEERQKALASKKSGKKKGSVIMPTFAPATLIIDDAQKSTARLMEEATSRVQAFQDIGQQVTTNSGLDTQVMSNSNKLQLLAAQQRATWNMAEAEENVPTSVNNAFSALQEDSDNEWENPEETAPAPLFQFAAPSFGLPQAVPTTNNQEDDDPDL